MEAIAMPQSPANRLNTRSRARACIHGIVTVLLAYSVALELRNGKYAV